MSHPLRLARWTGTLVILAVLGAVTALVTPPAGANPLPPSKLYMHVQPEDPYHCSPPSVNSCEDLQQQTSATGLV